jgi:DNA mismatch endonuclease (patch repair protein)
MVDVVSKLARSRMMAGIRGQNTGPERMIRKQLWRAGFRYGLGKRRLPGRPDVVLPKWRVAIFVHGCFWHGHARCRYFRFPATKPSFWRNKILSNRERDARVTQDLSDLGWRCIVVWECALRDDANHAAALISRLVRGNALLAEIRSTRRHAVAIVRKRRR